VRAARVALAIAIALALQTTLAHFLTRGAIIDLMLVAVVYVALTGGSVAGLVAGAIGGLAQDALAATGVSVVETGTGLFAARSIIGSAGWRRRSWIRRRDRRHPVHRREPLPRFLVFFVATLAHAAMFLGLYALLDPALRGRRTERRQPGRRERASAWRSSRRRAAAGVREEPPAGRSRMRIGRRGLGRPARAPA